MKQKIDKHVFVFQITVFELVVGILTITKRILIIGTQSVKKTMLKFEISLREIFSISLKVI